LVDDIRFVGIAAAFALLFVGVPAGMLIAATVHFAFKRGRQIVWGLYGVAVATLTVGYALLGAGAYPYPLRDRLLLVGITMGVLLLPVPLALGVVGQTGVRIRRRVLIALGAVLSPALLLSAPLVLLINCVLTGSCL
jgi:hypothetical protein